MKGLPSRVLTLSFRCFDAKAKLRRIPEPMRARTEQTELDHNQDPPPVGRECCRRPCRCCSRESRRDFAHRRKMGFCTPAKDGILHTGQRRDFAHRQKTGFCTPAEDGILHTGRRRDFAHRRKTGFCTPSEDGILHTGRRRDFAHRPFWPQLLWRVCWILCPATKDFAL